MKNQKKIVAFGEIMLRLTPPDYTTISQARNFVANYGGGEANVLVSLSHLGHETEFLTKLPDNQLGDSAIKHLKSHGVDTSHVVRGASNIGMYFVETGFGGRPSKVLYNRKHSAITRINESEILNITNRINEYEEYLRNIYFYLRKFYNIPEVEWLTKNS